MKKIMILIIVILISFSSAMAAEYDYPDIFIKSGKLDALIVVGNQAPASDVIAQSNLMQYFSGYGVSTTSSAKLSSEISTIDQNMILIGSACTNPLTAQVLGNPQPCNKGVQPGKPLIKLFRNSIYFHLVVAGYTEKETRDAVSSLANYDGFELSENFDVNEEQAETIKNNSINITKSIEDEKNRVAEELNRKISTAKSDENEMDEKYAVGESITIPNETVSERQSQDEKKNQGNMITKIIGWIKSLFRQQK